MPRKTNFTANGNDYYRVTKTIGKNADGSPIRKQFYGSSKKEAEQKRDEYMAGIKQGLAVDYDKATFAAAFEHWLKHVHRPSIKLSSYNQYESLHRMHIANSGLAGMRLADITAANVQGVYNSLSETVTPSTVNKTHKLLRVFFTYCLKADIILRDPLLAVKLPKLPPQSEKNTALSDVDLAKLVQAAKDDIKHFPFVFAAFTGLRSGELLALTFRDLDFHTGMINVSKSVNYVHVDGNYMYVVEDVKTTAGLRRVPILDEIRPLLENHIALTRQSQKVVGIDGNFLLFPASTGAHRNQRYFINLYKRLCAQLGINKGCTIHSLRHTFCTILARQGVSLLEASRLMGHANINVTAKIYSHVSDEEKKNAVQKLSAYFN